MKRRRRVDSADNKSTTTSPFESIKRRGSLILEAVNETEKKLEKQIEATWEQSKRLLFTIDEIPHHLRDNEFIFNRLSGVL